MEKCGRDNVIKQRYIIPLSRFFEIENPIAGNITAL
jgi:hypothetical protein